MVVCNDISCADSIWDKADTFGDSQSSDDISTFHIKQKIQEHDGQIETITSDVASLAQEIRTASIGRVDDVKHLINVTSLDNERYNVTNPLQCLLYQEQDGDTYYAESIDMDLYGYGDSASEAIDDIKKEFIIWYDTLDSKADSELSDYMKAKKVSLFKSIGRNDERQ